jgi:hypothetical protein
MSSSVEEKSNFNVVNNFYFNEKGSKSISPSVETKLNINVVIFFFEKSSKSMLSSVEAKPNINVVIFFLFQEKFKINFVVVINGGKINYQCSQLTFS